MSHPTVVPESGRRSPSRAGKIALGSVRSRVGLGVVALLSLAVAGFSAYLYASASLRELAEDGAGLGSTYVDAPVVIQIAFYLHIATGVLALAIGPVQFVHRLRRRRPRLHRVIGRVYFVAVFSSAVFALVIAPFSAAGFVALFGFSSLAGLWVLTGVRAFSAARRRDFAGHQAWMIRNYALTFAAPTLRLWLAVLIILQIVQASMSGTEVDAQAVYDNAYAVVPFLCWLPNLVVAEWLIRRRGLPSYQITAPPAYVPVAGVGQPEEEPLDAPPPGVNAVPIAQRGIEA